MNRLRVGLGVVIAGLYVAAVPLAAACNLSFSTIDTNVLWNVNGGYDPYNPSDAANTVRSTFRVLNSGSSNCDMFVTFDRGNGNDPAYVRRASNGPHTIQYQLYRADNYNDSQILKHFNDIVGNGNIKRGQVRKSRTVNRVYRVFVPKEQNVPPGDYTDTVQVRLYEGKWNQSHTLIQTVSVTFTIRVLRIMDLYVDDTTDINSLNLDFGALNAGNQSENFDVRVKTNGTYDLTAQSQNSGNLKHVNPSVTTQIPTVFLFRGVQHNLSTGLPVTLISGGSPTPSLGDTFPASLQVNNFDPNSKVTGAYQDILTFEVKEP